MFFVGSVWFVGEEFLVLNEMVCGLLCNCVLGFVYQFYYLLLEFIVLENVCMLLLIGCMLIVEVCQWVVELLEWVGLGYCLLYKLVELFGGECQWVVIVCVLVNCLQLVLFDEFIGNFDQYIVQGIQELMLELSCLLQILFLVVIYDFQLVGYMDCILCLEEG